jgi:L-serine dehydratase
MRFKDVFSIIGPGMVGPSSSHTAGAVRIGRTARHLFGGLPEQADITLYGSFADTYRGHGTDLALAGGLLDFDTDDLRIRDALKLAEAAGIQITFRTANKLAIHPNTASLTLRGHGLADVIEGASIGGGNIEITKVNGFDVNFTAFYPTLLIFHKDRKGMVADMTRVLSAHDVNISGMDVDRKARSGHALTVIEADQSITAQLIEDILLLSDVHRVSKVDLQSKEVIE